MDNKNLLGKNTQSHPDVILVEDSTTLALVYADYIRSAGYEVSIMDTGSACLEALETAVPPVVVLDLGLPDMDGRQILERIKAEGLKTSVIVITSNASLNTAIDAMRLGAFDYIVKPFNAARLATTLQNATSSFAHQTSTAVRKPGKAVQAAGDFIGTSAEMQAVYRTIESAAPSNATVFITGESGTGKEVCAQAVHATSARAEKAFVAINCAAIPRDLIESEIFGHVEGAFTGATAARKGAAAEADGGTLFLDEICEMDLDIQVKLLRLLQNGEYQRVGSSKTEVADLRIICATNREPQAEVRAGRFREDLFYRLHVIPIYLPPLRTRGADILSIAQHYLAKHSEAERKTFGRIAPDAAEAISRYSWPGNVRELQNAIQNAIVLHDANDLTAAMLPSWVQGSRSQYEYKSPQLVETKSSPAPGGTVAVSSADSGPKRSSDIRPLWLVEKEAILEALRICDNNVTRAAACLEVGASTIYRKKAEWDAKDQFQANGNAA